MNGIKKLFVNKRNENDLTLKSINKSVSLVEGLNEGVAVRILKRIRELLVHFESASVTMKVQNLTHL